MAGCLNWMDLLLLLDEEDIYLSFSQLLFLFFFAINASFLLVKQLSPCSY